MSNSILQDWLNLLCQMLPHIQAGLFLPAAEEGSQPLPPLTWPPQSPPDQDILSAVEMARSRQASVATSRSPADGGDPDLILACTLPSTGLPSTGRFRGVVGICATVSASQQNSVMQLLQWGGAWLQLLESGGEAGGEGNAGSPASLDTTELLPILDCQGAELAAIAAATAVARKLHCERVAIGLLDAGEVGVLGLSNTASFDRRTGLSQQIQAVIRETVAVGRDLRSGAEEGDSAASHAAHEILARTGGHCVYSYLLGKANGVVGVMVLEQARSLDTAGAQYCAQIAPWLAALLAMKQEQEHSSAPWPRRLRRLLAGANRRMTYAIAAGLAALLLFAAGSATDKVVADAALEGAIQRAIVAPFDGYVAASRHRAGEEVSEGELLASLKDDDLRLEQQKWQSQRAELEREYRKALAALDHSQARIFQSQVEQAQAELELLNYQLDRVELRAPFDGIIIEGDLSQQLGVPVDRGQLLFQVAPLNEYRVVLAVDEQDIPLISAGQAGNLTLAALPSTQLRFRVSQVSSVAVASSGVNRFRVEADLLDTAALQSLRPGMQGIAKVEIGETTRVGGWSRRLIGWIQLQLWKWAP